MAIILNNKYRLCFKGLLNEEKIKSIIEPIGLDINKNNDFLFNKKDNSFKCSAFAFHRSRFLNFGINKLKTHPRFQEYLKVKKSTTHAEIDLLLNLERNNNIDNVTDIVVVRGVVNALPSLPCNLCYAHIIDKFEGKKVKLWFLNMYNKWDCVQL